VIIWTPTPATSTKAEAEALLWDLERTAAELQRGSVDAYWRYIDQVVDQIHTVRARIAAA
jgi:hypothetical protein